MCRLNAEWILSMQNSKSFAALIGVERAAKKIKQLETIENYIGKGRQRSTTAKHTL